MGLLLPSLLRALHHTCCILLYICTHAEDRGNNPGNGVQGREQLTSSNELCKANVLHAAKDLLAERNERSV